MPGDKDLTFNLKLDRSQAKAEQRAHAADHAKLEKEMQAVTTAAEKAKTDTAVEASRRRAQAAIDAYYKSTQAAKEEKKAHEDAGNAGLSSFSKMGVAAAAAQVAFQGVLKVVNSIGAAVTDAGERSKRLTSQFGDERDQLRELATLMGRTADSKFAIEMARFGAKTGMTSGERTGFLTEFMNAGAQFEGKTIAGGEFRQFAEQAAALSLAKGIRPEQAGDVAGGILGLTNFDKFGGQASEQALAQMNMTLATLGRGKGDNAVLARQFSMLASASLSEDKLQGAFQRPEEVAAVISVAAEKSAPQAAELAKMAGRGLRDFDNPLIKRSGVTPTDSFIQAFTKINAQVSQEVQARQAKTPGFKVEDLLRENIKDEGTIDAFNVFLNKGVAGGGFADRLAFAQQNAGVDVAGGVLQDFFGTDTGRRRLRQQELAASQAAQGAKRSQLDLVRLEAARGLIDRGELNTNASGIKDYLIDATSFRLLGSAEQLRIDEETQRLLMARSPAGTKAAPFSDMFNVTPLAREDDLMRRMARITEAGGDPTRASGETIQVLKEIRDAVQMRKDAAAVVPPPRMPGPPVVRRDRS